MNDKNNSLILAAILAAIAAAVHAADLPLDLKPLALEVYGLRGAVAIDSNTVVAVLGASATGARGKASAWRVRNPKANDERLPEDHPVT